MGQDENNFVTQAQLILNFPEFEWDEFFGGDFIGYSKVLETKIALNKIGDKWEVIIEIDDRAVAKMEGENPLNLIEVALEAS